MKWFFHTVISILICAILVAACQRNDSLSLRDVGGEEFVFSSPITAIVDAGDSLLVGTNDGKISYFNTNNGDHNEYRTVTGGAIYDLEIYGDYLYFSVQDGGVKRVLLKKPDDDPETFLINGKESNYSPYDILVTDNGNTLYAATSNGFYRWNTVKPEEYAEPIEVLPNAAPHRFFSVIRNGSDGVIFAGIPGVFKYEDKELKEVHHFSTLALHDGYQLRKNGGFFIGYEHPADSLSSFKRDPLNFVTGNGFVYAVSERAIEVINLSDYSSTLVDLPENHLNRARNKSCRSVCLIKGAFVYAAPGGNLLYRLPAKLSNSEDIVSLCQKDDDEIYALSANNDLYTLSVQREGSKSIVSRPRYVRTIPAGNQVRLIAASEDAVFVFKDTVIHRFEGKSKDYIMDTPYSDKHAGNVTCNLWCDGTLFQGRTDMIRSYSYSNVNNQPVKEKELKGNGLKIRNSQPDYYPNHLVKIGDEVIFGTLHYGVYSVNVLSDSTEFKCLIDTINTPKVKDIQSFDNAAFVLTSDSLYRFSFDKSYGVKNGQWPIDQFGTKAFSYDRILPVANDKIYLYSDDNNFNRGVWGFSFNESSGWESFDTLSQSSSINDALFIKDMGLPIFCGSMGISYGDKGLEVAVNRPSLYTLRRIHAETYWWGLALAILTLLVFVFLVVYSYLEYGKRKVNNEIKQLGEKNLKLANGLEMRPRRTISELNDIIIGAKDGIEKLHLREVYMKLTRIIDQATDDIHVIEEQEERDRFHQLAKEVRAWTLDSFHSGYVIKLAEELISMSDSSIQLSCNIELFKNDSEKLKTLDEIGEMINEIKTIVSGNPMSEGSFIENERERKEQLDAAYMEKVKVFFGYYADEDKETSEWGKVFKNAVDKKRPSTYKLSFIFFPLSVKDNEGEWLPTLLGNFPTRKSEWKNGGRPPYYLLNFMDTTDYGLFRLIAGAGLRNLESKEKDL